MQPGDVLVGHSGGGFDATLAANARPDLVSHIVYLAAALPREGRTYPEAMAMRDAGDDLGDEFDGDVGEMLSYLKFDDDGAMTFADFDGAWKYFYHDCDEETARWAFDRLGPERFGDTTVTPVSVPHFWAADLPRSFILCQQDRSMPRWLADTVARRLGVEQLEHRCVALTVPVPPARVGRAPRTRDDHDARRPAGPRWNSADPPPENDVPLSCETCPLLATLVGFRSSPRVATARQASGMSTVFVGHAKRVRP